MSMRLRCFYEVAADAGNPSHPSTKLSFVYSHVGDDRNNVRGPASMLPCGTCSGTSNMKV